MDREILFRGKQIDNGEWMEGSVLRSGNGCVDIVPLNNSICEDKYGGLCAMKWREVDPETVCQYTGLTDKNGVKIFEGDIVEISDDEDEFYTIEWDNDTARFIILQTGNVMCGFDNYWGYEIEVIDNIFDNPELVINPECGVCKCRNCFSNSECCPQCEGTIYECEEYSETDIYNPDLLEGETHESHD